MAHELVLPIMIVSLEGGKEEQTLRVNPSDLRHWQIEEFLRQTGKADNTQRTHLYLNRAKFDDRSHQPLDQCQNLSIHSSCCTPA